MRLLSCIAAGAAALFLALPAAAALEAEVKTFVQEMAAKHRLDEKELSELMEGARFRQTIIDAITRPAEAKPWHQYRPIFVTEARARGGVAFWDEHEAWLLRAEETYGVPPEIIVAIIGVETRYGKHTGKYRVLDSLYTLAFGYPRRSAFFKRELEAFLLLSREETVDPTAIKGSYAGAMGMPQFISSSYRSYAVDFNGDGLRDLWGNPADVIGSVGNYFKRHGWKRGQEITLRADGVNGSHRHFIEAGMKPSLKVAELAAAGIRPQQAVDRDALSSLIELENAEGTEHWLGLNNFYVITRYNHSNLYSMAVYQLSRRIKALREAREEGSIDR